jgi:hypothetical protein
VTDAARAADGAASVDARSSSQDLGRTSDGAEGAGCEPGGGEGLCEDFESGSLDTKLWSAIRSGAGMVTVDSMNPHRGKFGLHLKVVPGGQLYAAVATSLKTVVKDNNFFTRVFVYVTPDLPTSAASGGSTHWAMVNALGKNPAGREIWNELGIEGDKRLIANPNYRGFGGAGIQEYPLFSKKQFPVKQWICIELYSDGRGNAMSRKVWQDDVELPELAEMRTTPSAPPIFDRLEIGVQQYHRVDLLSDVFMDDVRVSSQRIGCTR